jgi:hypothetical protein
MKNRLTAGLLLAVLTTMITLGFAASARAVTPGPLNLQNGFPIWWEDNAGQRVGMCFSAACAATPPLPGNAFSELTGFGDENFWWISGAAGIASLVEFAMEAAYATAPANGQQGPFTRVRVRAQGTLANAAVAITTPFGTINTTCDATGVVNFTNDDFSAPPAYVVPQVAGTSPTTFFTVVGTALVPGQVFTGLGPIVGGGTVSVVGCGINETTNQFTADGLFFESAAAPLANAAPVANPDKAAVRTGSTTGVILNVAANDTDADPAPRGINPKATAIGIVTQADVTPATAAALPLLAPNVPFTTAKGNTVTKNTDGTLTFTPSPTFTGDDTFNYTVQDNGGLVASSVAGVLVENLTVTRSVLRVKHMKWKIKGTTSTFDPNVLTTLGFPAHAITLHLGANAAGPVIGNAAVQAGGVWSFNGQSNVSPKAVRTTTTASSTGVVLTNQPLELR